MVLLSWWKQNPFCSTQVPRHFTPVWAVSHIAGFVSIPTAVLQLSQHSNRAMSSCSFTEIRSAAQLNLLSAGELSWKNVWAERTAGSQCFTSFMESTFSLSKWIWTVELDVCCGSDTKIWEMALFLLSQFLLPPYLGYCWSVLLIKTLLRTLGIPLLHRSYWMLSLLEIIVIDAPCQINVLKLTVEDLEKERDFYFGKLRNIELICQENEGENDPVLQRIVEILYATDVSNLL